MDDGYASCKGRTLNTARMVGMDQEQGEKNGVYVSGDRINNLRIADEIDLLEEELDEVQNNTDKLVKGADPLGLEVNISKTKTMVFGQETMERP